MFRVVRIARQYPRRAVALGHRPAASNAEKARAKAAAPQPSPVRRLRFRYSIERAVMEGRVFSRRVFDDNGRFSPGPRAEFDSIRDAAVAPRMRLD